MSIFLLWVWNLITFPAKSCKVIISPFSEWRVSDHIPGLQVVAQEGQNLEETETFVQRLEDCRLLGMFFPLFADLRKYPEIIPEVVINAS